MRHSHDSYWIPALVHMMDCSFLDLMHVAANLAAVPNVLADLEVSPMKWQWFDFEKLLTVPNV
jgi:hypothetical protein